MLALLLLAPIHLQPVWQVRAQPRVHTGAVQAGGGAQILLVSEGRTTALDVASGAALWSAPGRLAASDEDFAFVATSELSAYSRESGALRWRRPMGEWATVLGGELVLRVGRGAEAGSLVLDRGSGRTLWKTRGALQACGPGALREGARQGYARRTGEVLWSRPGPRPITAATHNGALWVYTPQAGRPLLSSVDCQSGATLAERTFEADFWPIGKGEWLGHLQSSDRDRSPGVQQVSGTTRFRATGPGVLLRLSPRGALEAWRPGSFTGLLPDHDLLRALRPVIGPVERDQLLARGPTVVVALATSIVGLRRVASAPPAQAVHVSGRLSGPCLTRCDGVAVELGSARTRTDSKCRFSLRGAFGRVLPLRVPGARKAECLPSGPWPAHIAITGPKVKFDVAVVETPDPAWESH